MRKIFVAAVVCMLFFSMGFPAYADAGAISHNEYDIAIEPEILSWNAVDTQYLNNGDTIITIITYDNTMSALTSSGTKSGSKTTYYQNSAGVTQWYIRVNGTFTYNGYSATCTNATVTAVSNTSSWKMTNKSVSKSGATATGKATANLYSGSSIIQSIQRTIKLTCSANGVLS